MILPPLVNEEKNNVIAGKDIEVGIDGDEPGGRGRDDAGFLVQFPT
jgi:hypothetical protein